MKSISFLVVGAAVALFGVGCTPSVSQNTGTPPPSLQTSSTSKLPSAPAPKPTSTSAPAPKPAQAPTSKAIAPKPQIAVVTIMNFQYFPQTVTVNDGDTIEWINKDSAPHTSTSDGFLLWDSGTLMQNGTFKRVFRTGTYHYHCNVHPNMVGTVIVR